MRGTIAQVFALLGVLTGLWAAVFVSGWVAAHWHGARPTLVFTALRWLVAALAGLAVAGFFQWWGDSLGKAVREGPLGWLDRGVGVLVGAGIGVTVGTLAVLGALTLPIPSGPGIAVAQARFPVPAMVMAADACSLGQHRLPATGWLRQRFLAAKRRAVRIRESGSESSKS